MTLTSSQHPNVRRRHGGVHAGSMWWGQQQQGGETHQGNVVAVVEPPDDAGPVRYRWPLTGVVTTDAAAKTRPRSP